MKPQFKLIAVSIRLADAAHEIRDLLHRGVEAMFDVSEQCKLVRTIRQGKEEVGSYKIPRRNLIDGRQLGHLAKYGRVRPNRCR